MAQNAGEIYVKISADANGLLRNFDRAVKGIERGADKIKRSFRDLESAGTDLSLAVSAPLALLGGRALQTAADLEQTEVAFRTLTGSAVEAEKVLSDIRTLALGTPFSFQGLAQAARLMKGFGFETQQVIPTLNVLTDAVAAFGGSGDDLDGIIRQLGQIQTKGRVLGEELSVIAERGIPAYEILREKLELTNEQIGKLGDQGIPAAQAIPALLEGIAERYAGAAAAQANTLAGVFNKTRDELSLALADIGTEIEEAFNLKEVLSGVANGVRAITASFKALSPEAKQFAIIATGIVTALGPVATVIGVIVGRVLPAFITGLRTLSLVASPLALKIGLIAAAIAGVGLVLKTAYDAFEGFRDAVIYIFNDVVYAAKKWASALLSIFAPIGRAIEELLGPALDNAKKSFDELANSSFGKKFGESFRNNIDEIKEFFSGFVDFFKAGGNEISEDLTTSAEDIRRAFEDALSSFNQDGVGKQTGLINELNKQIEKYEALAAASFDEQRIADYNDLIISLQKEIERLQNLTNFDSPITAELNTNFEKFRSEAELLNEVFLDEINFGDVLGEEFDKLVDAKVLENLGQKAIAVNEELTRTFTELGSALGASLATAGNGFRSFSTIAAQELRKVLIAQIKVLLANLGIAAGPAGLLAGLAGGFFAGQISKLFSNVNIPGLADGGIIPNGYANDSFLARLSSGEAVVDINKLYDSIERGGNQGSLIARVAGDELLVMLDRTRAKRQRFA